MLREVVVADDGEERPIEETIKLATVRLDNTAAEGLGSDAVQRMVPSIAVAKIFMVTKQV